MKGYPKFTYGDIVRFICNEETKEGDIAVIDAYGTFFDDSDVSYDIFVASEKCLYKHFREDFILEKIGHTDQIWGEEKNNEDN